MYMNIFAVVSTAPEESALFVRILLAAVAASVILVLGYLLHSPALVRSLLGEILTWVGLVIMSVGCFFTALDSIGLAYVMVLSGSVIAGLGIWLGQRKFRSMQKLYGEVALRSMLLDAEKVRDDASKS